MNSKNAINQVRDARNDLIQTDSQFAEMDRRLKAIDRIDQRAESDFYRADAEACRAENIARRYDRLDTTEAWRNSREWTQIALGHVQTQNAVCQLRDKLRCARRSLVNRLNQRIRRQLMKGSD